MALIKCPECGKDVSDKAVACIHCGYPIEETLEQKSSVNTVTQDVNTNQQSEVSEGFTLFSVAKEYVNLECKRCEKVFTYSRYRYFEVASPEYCIPNTLIQCPNCQNTAIPHSKITTKRNDTGCKKNGCLTTPIQEMNTFDEELDKLSSKYKKRILMIILLIIIPIIVWKIVGPKTVESGDGWKHQIGNFKKACDFQRTCHSEHATHRIHSFFGDYRYYCDECWITYDGQEDFDSLANKSSERSTDAKVCAKKVVEDNLRSPSTAKFCKYTEMTASNLGGNKWKITGYVDAQNSFGATVRENWTVTLTLTTSGFTDATVSFR